MKKIISIAIVVVLITGSCDHKQANATCNKYQKKSGDCLPDSLSALKKGKSLLMEKYVDIDSAKSVFRTELVGDSVWHVSVKSNAYIIKQKDSMARNQGSQRVLINKHTCQVIAYYLAR